jgi:diguanylate cyclase (GGDEF)-like protein
MLPPLTFLGRELIFDSIALSSTVVLALFSIDFLQVAKFDRASFIAVIAATALALSIFVTDFFPTTTVAFDWTLIVVLAFYAALLFAGVRAMQRHQRAALIFSIGVGCSVVGYVLNMSSYLWPRQDLVVYALEAAQCVQALLLAMAVAEGVQASRAERDKLVLESRHLAQLAMRDGLTGVLNRRSFDQAMTDAANGAVGEGARLGILILDIDHFKDYNDSLGHQAGDEALRRVATACASCVRGGDIFARYGGEEFAAIVPGASMEDLTMIADRMRANVGALAMPRGDGAPLTISIGGASQSPASMQAALAILRLADEALYDAKNGGRDRVVMA